MNNTLQYWHNAFPFLTQQVSTFSHEVQRKCLNRKKIKNESSTEKSVKSLKPKKMGLKSELSVCMYVVTFIVIV